MECVCPKSLPDISFLMGFPLAKIESKSLMAAKFLPPILISACESHNFAFEIVKKSENKDRMRLVRY